MWLGPQGNNHQCLQHGLGGGFCNQASPAVNHDYGAWFKSCESANLAFFIVVVLLSVLVTFLLCLWALRVIFTKRPTKVKVWRAWHVLDSVGEACTSSSPSCATTLFLRRRTGITMARSCATPRRTSSACLKRVAATIRLASGLQCLCQTVRRRYRARSSTCSVRTA